MVDKQGTGDVLGKIELDGLGTLYIEDDGHHDPDVTTRVDTGGDDRTYLATVLSTMREEMGDRKFMETIENVVAGGPSNGGSTSTTNFDLTGPFVCSDCHRTWPGEYEQPGGLCPDCVESI